MIDKVKNHILKYIRKYISLAVAVVALPFVTFNSFADYSSYPQYVFSLPKAYSQHLFDNGTGTFHRDFTKGDDGNYHMTSDGTTWDTAIEIFLYIPNTTETDYIFNFPVNTNIYDYYVFHSFTIDNINNPTVITGYDFGYYDENNTFIVNNVTSDRIDKELIYRSNVTGANSKSRSYQYTAKLNLDFIGTYNLGVLRYYGNGSLDGEDTYLWNMSVIAVNKGTAAGDVNNIITAIQQQNNLIENGNDETEDVVTDFNEVFEEFNTQLEEIETFETQFTDDFNAANETYLNELSQFAMPYGVINAGNWLSTSMQTIYDNSDDYKMLWLVPLLLGVPLVIFFFKRGDNSE